MTIQHLAAERDGAAAERDRSGTEQDPGEAERDNFGWCRGDGDDDD